MGEAVKTVSPPLKAFKLCFSSHSTFLLFSRMLIEVGQSGKYHNALCLSTQILNIALFLFSLGTITMVVQD